MAGQRLEYWPQMFLGNYEAADECRDCFCSVSKFCQGKCSADGELERLVDKRACLFYHHLLR